MTKCVIIDVKFEKQICLQLLICSPCQVSLDYDYVKVVFQIWNWKGVSEKEPSLHVNLSNAYDVHKYLISAQPIYTLKTVEFPIFKLAH